MGFTDSFKKVIGLADIDEDEIVTEDELNHINEPVIDEEVYKKAIKSDEINGDIVSSNIVE